MRCIVVDDEQHAIDILVHYIGQTPHLELCGTYTNPIEAMHAVAKDDAELIFLDVQMPELSGIDLIRALQGKVKVILTTAYSEFALESYELDVVDYLLKPIRFPRFLAAVQKAMKQANMPEMTEIPVTDDDYLFVKTESKGKLLKINLDEIDFIEGMKNYVAIHREGGKTLVYTSMKDLEDRLPPRQFIRVHKSFIIPINRITGIEGNMVRLKNVKQDILIGESYRPALMEIIRGKMLR